MGFPGGSPACNVGGWVESLGWEDLLEKETATRSSILAWKIRTEEPGGYSPWSWERVVYNLATEQQQQQ